jgi:hypothetical protein
VVFARSSLDTGYGALMPSGSEKGALKNIPSPLRWFYRPPLVSDHLSFRFLHIGLHGRLIPAHRSPS